MITHNLKILIRCGAVKNLLIEEDWGTQKYYLAYFLKSEPHHPYYLTNLKYKRRAFTLKKLLNELNDLYNYSVEITSIPYPDVYFKSTLWGSLNEQTQNVPTAESENLFTWQQNQRSE